MIDLNDFTIEEFHLFLANESVFAPKGISDAYFYYVRREVFDLVANKIIDHVTTGSILKESERPTKRHAVVPLIHLWDYIVSAVTYGDSHTLELSSPMEITNGNVAVSLSIGQMNHIGDYWWSDFIKTAVQSLSPTPVVTEDGYIQKEQLWVYPTDEGPYPYPPVSSENYWPRQNATNKKFFSVLFNSKKTGEVFTDKVVRVVDAIKYTNLVTIWVLKSVLSTLCLRSDKLSDPLRIFTNVVSNYEVNGRLGGARMTFVKTRDGWSQLPFGKPVDFFENELYKISPPYAVRKDLFEMVDRTDVKKVVISRIGDYYELVGVLNE